MRSLAGTMRYSLQYGMHFPVLIVGAEQSELIW